MKHTGAIFDRRRIAPLVTVRVEFLSFFFSGKKFGGGLDGELSLSARSPEQTLISRVGKPELLANSALFRTTAVPVFSSFCSKTLSFEYRKNKCTKESKKENIESKRSV